LITVISSFMPNYQTILEGPLLVAEEKDTGLEPLVARIHIFMTAV